MNLRKLAKGQDCQMRIPGVCNFDPETTVLAHIRKGGVAGVGQKPKDLIGVWSCSDCHDVIDGRRIMHGLAVDSYILEAMCRTLDKVSEALDHDK